MSQSTLENFQRSGVECPTCGRSDFSSEKGMKQHHARAHGESISGFTLVCDWCGDEYTRRKATLTGEYGYCSRSCRGAHKSHMNSTPRQPEKRCQICGEAYNPRKYRKEQSKTCSPECRGEWLSRNFSGQNSHFWRGGKSVSDAVKKTLSTNAWHRVAEEYRETTDRTCEKCGAPTDEFEQRLDVHHIVPLNCGGTNNHYNLMLLCRSCHREAESFIRQYPEFDPVLVE
ncbi:HNH endonuclease [Haloarcula tailed virus 3]|uniref:HNH endonuclease n=1 Tax=Haloarcula tailed virus 3 TaxID=2877990 RepID=A0AAE9BYW4_9CAUD|nr:HNH endonuclease [Haloarcula tailed virus 3]UBF23364.1 HNH endonuclease [Haloarcula tailed virus 3]